MQKKKIGLIYQGNDTDNIWGCSVTTYYLKKAFEKLGHDVWRHSVTYASTDKKNMFDGTDLLIVEGTPKWLIPDIIWNNASFRIFWWLSDLYYTKENIPYSGFDGIATNSINGFDYLKLLLPTSKIDLAIDENLCIETQLTPEYGRDFVYLGSYPHKSESQMNLLFSPAQKHNFSLWGKGWKKSKYAAFAKGILPFNNIGQLYRSSMASFLLTEERQKERGMFNNRVYEVLGSGCIAISENYSALERSDIGKYISFCKNQHDTESLLVNIVCNYENYTRKQANVREYIRNNHSYNARAKDFLKMYENHCSTGHTQRSDRIGFSEKIVE